MTPKIREWRESAGLTLEQMANKLGVHLSTLQKWEKGKNAVDWEDICKIADLFGVSPIAIMFAPEDRALATRLDRLIQLGLNLGPNETEKLLELGQMMVSPKREAPND